MATMAFVLATRDGKLDEPRGVWTELNGQGGMTSGLRSGVAGVCAGTYTQWEITRGDIAIIYFEGDELERGLRFLATSEDPFDLRGWRTKVADADRADFLRAGAAPAAALVVDVGV